MKTILLIALVVTLSGCKTWKIWPPADNSTAKALERYEELYGSEPPWLNMDVASEREMLAMEEWELQHPEEAAAWRKIILEDAAMQRKFNREIREARSRDNN